MSTSLKWRLGLGFFLAFVAGGATGGFLAASHARHLRTDFAHAHHWLTERMRSRMKEELDLTPEQIEKTAPIFDHTASKLERIRVETSARVHQVIAETNSALAPELTESQRANLEALETRPRPGRQSRNAPGKRAPPPSE
jgi:hypothetical protein